MKGRLSMEEKSVCGGDDGGWCDMNALAKRFNEQTKRFTTYATEKLKCGTHVKRKKVDKIDKFLS